MAEYLSKREPDVVTGAIDAVPSDTTDPDDGRFVRAAAQKTAFGSEW